MIRMDVAALERLGEVVRTERGLRERLLAMRADPAVATALSVCRALPDGLRAPMIIWNLRTLDSAAATLARALVCGEPLDRAALTGVLGEPLATAVRSVGLLVDAGDGRERAALLVRRDDSGVTLVEPRVETTTEDATHVPLPPMAREITLAVHAGGNGVRLAGAAQRVFALEPHPRARALARVNAALVGANVDVVASVDELPPEPIDRLAAESLEPFLALLPRLSARGVATLSIETPADAATIARSLPEGVRAVLFEFPTTPADELCARIAAQRVPELGPEYEAAFVSLRSAITEDHHRVVAIVQRSAGGPTFTAVRTLPAARPFEKLPVARAFVAAELAVATDERLLAARVRIAPAARLIGDGDLLKIPSLREPLAVAPATLNLLLALHGATSVQAVAGARSALPFIRESLLSGVLESHRAEAAS